MALGRVPGQFRVKRFLQQIHQRGTAPHALLFSGMAGVGKRAMAREFAKLMNCLDPRNQDCCDQCRSCKKCEAGVHPDVIWVSPDGAFIKIAQVRDVQNRLRFPPFEGFKRLTILEEAQNLTEEAGNALLKILEEPPGDNLFILLTPEPQMILTTLASRCCHVRFQPLEEELILETLAGQSPGRDPAARRAARLSLGSLDLARRFAREGLLSHWEGLVANMEKLSSLSITGLFKYVSDWVKSTEDLEQDLQGIKFWMRDVILTTLDPTYEAVFELDTSCLPAFRKAPTEALLEIYDELEAAGHHLALNGNKQLILEGLVLAIRNILHGKSHRNPISQMR